MNAKKEDADFCVIKVVVDSTDGFCVWFSGEEDGVLTSDHGVRVWRSRDEAVAAVRAGGFSLSSEDVACYDFDRIAAFVAGEPLDVGWSELLLAWNLLVDVARSTRDDDFASDEARELDLYNHLFYLDGNAAVVNAGPRPLDGEEMRRLRLVLERGLAMLRRNWAAIE